MKRHIPNTITCLNLASGFIAIIFAINGNLAIASWLIIAAMTFDFFDGFSARALKSYSDIGKELDSLADMVSFGVAPAIILYKQMELSLGLSTPYDILSLPSGQLFPLLVTVLMPICAGLRLAKFNIDDTQKDSFKGLATPASALFVVSTVLANRYSDAQLATWLFGSTASIIAITIILSLLMVSRIPMLSLKFHNLNFKENASRFIFLALAILTILFFGIGGAPLIIPIYIITSIVSMFF